MRKYTLEDIHKFILQELDTPDGERLVSLGLMRHIIEALIDEKKADTQVTT